MQNSLKNKLLIILAFFILLILIITKSSFANSDLVFSDGNTYTVPDFTLDENSNYFISYNLNDNSLSIYMYSNTYKLIKNKQGTFYCFNLYDADNNMVSGDNIHCLKYNASLVLSRNYYVGGVAYQDYIVYFSNVDILDTEGNLVFQVAPQVVATQLSQIVEQAEPEKTLAEVVGILPLILMTIVGLIGLRKALRFLQKLLRQS